MTPRYTIGRALALGLALYACGNKDGDTGAAASVDAGGSIDGSLPRDGAPPANDGGTAVDAAPPPAPTSGTWYSPIVETFWDQEVTNVHVESDDSWDVPDSATIGFDLTTDGQARAYVIPIQLPYLAPGQTLSGATFSFNYVGKSGTPVHNVDLYGLARTSTSATPLPLATDYYEGKSDSNNTLLQAAMITPTSAPGVMTCANAALLTWLNAQYKTVGAGGYVFLRLSPDGLEDQSAFRTYYLINNSYAQNRQNIPSLALTTTGAIAAVPGQSLFTFILPGAEKTSAGVFDTASGALVRTLWSNVRYPGGQSYAIWNGKDDAGNAATAGPYTLKLRYHHATETWDGVVGNTSRSTLGHNGWRSNKPVFDIAFDPNSTTGFVALGYNEIRNIFNEFATDNPQVLVPLAPRDNGGTPIVGQPYYFLRFVATDGNLVYWAKCAMSLGGSAQTYVFATTMDGTSIHHFSAGTAVASSPGNQVVSNAIDVDPSTAMANPASGLAVQKSGDLLFVSHSTLGSVKVFNKTTGAYLNAITVPTPDQISVDGSGNLYVLSATSVFKYTVDPTTGAGTKDTSFSLGGLAAPAALGASANAAIVVVADGGSSQQIKVYNSITGALVVAYGKAGGYAMNGPAITTDKFMFGDVATAGTSTYVSFAPDGSFWIGDQGDERILHFSVSGAAVTYVNEIDYVPLSYVTTVDQNDPTRVFNQWLEYSIDYTKPLDNGTNGSWKLTKNWYGGLSPATYNGFEYGLYCVATLSNGRTYALAHNFSSGNVDVLELTADGLRITSKHFPGSPYPRLHADGSIHTTDGSGSTAPGTLYAPQKFSLASPPFDANGDPSWGSSTNILQITPAQGDPIPFDQNFYPAVLVDTTAGNIVPILDNGTDTGFHLGGVPAGGGSFLWKTAPTATGGKSYAGKFPNDDHFDVGNGVNYPASVYAVYGNEILVDYNGEFWKNNEASQWLLYEDDGLMLDRFGTLGILQTNFDTLAGFAGNAFSPTLVTNPATGALLLYHNDESASGGVVRWTLDLSSKVLLRGSSSAGAVTYVH